MSRHLAAREWPALLVGLAALLLHGGPALRAPTRLALGGDWTEAPGHLWGLWTATDGLLEHGPLWRAAPGLAWPEGFEGHLIDPSSLLLFVPGWLLAGGGAAGATLGWNLLHLGTLALGGLGAWALAHRAAPDDAPAHAAARAVAVAVVAFAPFWVDQPYLGRTEYLACLLLPGVVHLLLRFVEGGGWRLGLAAALLLGLVGTSTGYTGIFAALLLAPLGLGVLAAGPDRGRRLGRLVAVAVGSLVVAAPSILALSQDPHLGDRVSAPVGALVEWRACEILRLCDSAGLGGKVHQPLVLGLAVPVLSAVALALAPRRSLPWVLLAGWLLAWGLAGARLVQPLLPALPALGAIKEWARIASVLPVPLAVVAATGARRLAERADHRAPLVGLALAALVAADGLSFPRLALPDRLPTFAVAPPDGLVEALAHLPAGPIVTLPLESVPRRGRAAAPGFHALWARTHGRPVSAGLDGHHDAAGRSSGLVQAVEDLQTRLLQGRAPLAVDSRCLRRDARALREAGYTGLVVVGDDEVAVRTAALVETALGPAPHVVGQVHAWTLPERRGSVEWCTRWQAHEDATTTGPGRSR